METTFKLISLLNSWRVNNMNLFTRWNVTILALGVLLIQGCGSALTRLDAVPPELTEQAEIPGMPGIRYVGGRDMSGLLKVSVEGTRLELESLTSQGHRGAMPPMSMLAISGGGDNGAFTAGALNAWTAKGDRPEFKLVTGISTGALIAPFAFLGPKYDATLKEVYTTISPKDVLVPRGLLAGAFGDAMADAAPLWKLTRKSVNEAFLKEVAAEYAKGRFLLVATADIDARRPIIWDMGKIASYGGPDALDLFVSVIIASASIPVGFPPVMIDVEAGGQQYQEMHVDGGIMAQVFAYPVGISAQQMDDATGLQRDRTLYVIRNARLDPDWAQVERQTMSVGGRALTSLIHSQGIGDLFRIYARAERDGVDFNLAFIPSDFNEPHPEEFDNTYMRALYQAGYDTMMKDFSWLKVPPGFQDDSVPASK
jgi:predicted acylesterase/phospholipase RssA